MSSPFSYEGKRVVVTGAATGVSAEHVTVLDVKQPAGPHDRYFEVNLADEAAVASAFGNLVFPDDENGPRSTNDEG